MILVKTKLGLSDIHRLGIFADQFIKKDTVIWRYQPGYDIKISQELFATLPEPAQKQVMHYGYINNDMYVMCTDDSRYFNHSSNPNTYEMNSDDGEGLTVAARDIERGEELTCNYHEFDDDDKRKLSNTSEEELL